MRYTHEILRRFDFFGKQEQWTSHHTPYSFVLLLFLFEDVRRSEMNDREAICVDNTRQWHPH